MKPATLHADVEAELRAVLGYYERQRTGLSGEFLREFEAALQRLRENPQAYAMIRTLLGTHLGRFDQVTPVVTTQEAPR